MCISARSWSKPELPQYSKAPNPTRPTRKSLGPKRDLNEDGAAGEVETPTEETTAETVATGLRRLHLLVLTRPQRLLLHLRLVHLTTTTPTTVAPTTTTKARNTMALRQGVTGSASKKPTK